MRKKLDEDKKRNKLIGIKVQANTREQLDYIANREQLTVSTLINEILINYIDNYFKIARINWEKVPPEEKRKEG